MFQDIAAKNPESALLVNYLFIFLPCEFQISTVSPHCRPAVEKAIRICVDVQQVLARFGITDHKVWADSIARMQVVMPERNDEDFRPTTSRRKWSIKVRRHVWLQFNRNCYYCGDELQSWQGHFMHLDHLIPLAEGGRDEVSNLVPACPACNLEKGKSVFPEASRKSDVSHP